MEIFIGIVVVIIVLSLIPAVKKLVNLGITRLQHDEDIRYGQACYKAGMEHQKESDNKKG